MGAATLVSVQEYLTTVYEPDCDYVDGVIVERNVGEFTHGNLQGHLYSYYLSRRKKFGLYPCLEVRVQVSSTRFRVPDLCLVAGKKPLEPILTRPPLAVIEILSPEDRLSRMQERIDDYLRFGVRYVFLLDPETRRAWLHTAEGSHEVKDLEIRNGEAVVTVPLGEIFAAIDEE